jgi:hypothetical protein
MCTRPHRKRYTNTCSILGLFRVSRSEPPSDPASSRQLSPELLASAGGGRVLLRDEEEAGDAAVFSEADPGSCDRSGCSFSEANPRG